MSRVTTMKERTIESIMTKNPICVMGATGATELARILDADRISGVPVVDGQDRLIGVVSRTDLLELYVEGPPGRPPGPAATALGEAGRRSDALGVVSDFMNSEPVTAKPNETIGEVARRMADERVHRVVVVDNGNHVLGIVTSLDMVGVIAKSS
jgi:CBS domain-containing protein